MAGEPQEWVNRILKDFDFSTLEGTTPPMQEREVVPQGLAEDKVFLQKIITEIYVYTDVEKKTFGTTSIQDIVVLGEMSREEAMKIVDDRKKRKRRKSE